MNKIQDISGRIGMNLEVLVSTMNRNSFELIEKMNIKSDCLIINQSNDFTQNLENHTVNNFRMLSYQERGLSKSRNRALEETIGDICLIADDDVVYRDDYVEKIVGAHKEYSDYDIIVFAVPTTNTERSKKYYSKRKRMGYIRSLKVASFEISFKKKSIIDNNVRFNEDFGAGSGKVAMGEENIFLYECLRKGLKILYLPIVIGVVTHEESTWFKGYTEKYFRDLGACYAAMSSHFKYLLAMQFIIRKYSKYKNSVSLLKAYRNIMVGLKNYSSAH